MATQLYTNANFSRIEKKTQEDEQTENTQGLECFSSKDMIRNSERTLPQLENIPKL